MDQNKSYATFETKCRCNQSFALGRDVIIKHGKMFCSEECLRIFEEYELTHQDFCFCGDPNCATPNEPHNSEFNPQEVEKIF